MSTPLGPTSEPSDSSPNGGSDSSSGFEYGGSVPYGTPDPFATPEQAPQLSFEKPAGPPPPPIPSPTPPGGTNPYYDGVPPAFYGQAPQAHDPYRTPTVGQVQPPMQGGYSQPISSPYGAPGMYGAPSHLYGTPTPKTNIPSLVGMILSIVAVVSCLFGIVLGLAGLILGIIGIIQVNSSQGAQKGRGFAITAIVVGAFALLLYGYYLPYF